MPRRKRSKKWISWLIILVLLIVAGVVCYLVWDNYFNDKKKNEQGEPETSEEVKKDNDTEDDEMIKEDDKRVKQYEGDDPNEAEELSGVVTYAGVVGEKVVIRANIDQYLGDGSCKLRIINDDSVAYEETARITSAASTATCEGFDIPLNRISEGKYKIVIKIEANEKNGTIEGTLDI